MVSCSFFFSSRRRHTRSLCDWSSDVCSSDLSGGSGGSEAPGDREPQKGEGDGTVPSNHDIVSQLQEGKLERGRRRSEERRVGKECRSRLEHDNEKENKV